MPPAIGRLTGRNVTEIRFRTLPDEPVQLGELLVAEAAGKAEERGDGQAKERANGQPGPRAQTPEAQAPPFYLRVTDLEYGAEARDAHWEDRIAGTLLSAPEAHDLVLFDRDERLYRTVVASPLGFLQGESFRKPKTLPQHFATVRRPVTGDFRFLAPRPGDLELGHLRSGDEKLPDRLGLEPAALAQHLGIFATTGMGKSNLLKVLAGSCLESGKVGLLLLDPHGEYADGGAGVHRDGRPHRGLLHHPRADRLHVYSSRPIQGFAGAVHDLVVSAGEIQTWDVQNVYNVTGPQEEALLALGNRFGPRWLLEVDQRSVEELDATLGAGKFHPGTLNVLKRRAEQILRQPSVHRDDLLSTTQAILNDLALGHVVLVDTSGLFPNEELLVSAVLARRVLERHRDAYRRPDEFRGLVPTCVILEEAQRVLNARAGSGNVFAQIAREGRKFKVGLGAVTQQPRLISDELLSQFNTLFILGLADPTDRERVRMGARQDLSAVDKEIQMLEPGEALVTTPGAPFALPLKAHLYEERILEVPAAPARLQPAVRLDAGFV